MEPSLQNRLLSPVHNVSLNKESKGTLLYLPPLYLNLPNDLSSI